MRTFLLTLLFLATLQTALAAEPKDDEAVDAPSRVARLGYTDGQVEMAPAGTEEWTEALLNRPLTTDDRLWVGRGGKAELQAGSTVIYLDEDTGFSFLDLDDDLLHMSLTDGAATLRVRRRSENESIEIETPNATVTLLHPGEYHIQVTEDGAATVVDTRSGTSAVAGEKDTYTVRANERGIFRGTDELSADIEGLGPRTSFEEWANEREKRDLAARSSQYVSRDVIGYEDLDDSGDWSSDPEYGYVWTPAHVAAGWAPYRFGRWVWVSPWGWTWVDNYRWGFAPFHYGRWAYSRSRWCWVPGPRHIRPVYAPALVGWVGAGGTAISVSIGSGVGWFPLGPREVYVPGYRYSRRYIHDVNVSNTLIVNNVHIDDAYRGRPHFDYRYGHLPRAVTLVPRNRFVGGRPLDGYLPVNERDLRRWHHDARPPAIAPDRSSVLASRLVANRPPVRPLIRAHQLDADRDNGAFLARRAGPTRVPFDVERRAIEANHGRPVDRTRIISNNPRAIAREREDFRNEWAQRRPGDRPRRDEDRNAQVRPAPQPSALQPSRQERAAERERGGPDKSFVRDRNGLSDRPAWARQRGETPRSNDLQQSESRAGRIPARDRDTPRPEERSPAQQADGRPNASTGFNELRRDAARPGWSGVHGNDNNPSADRERRFESRPRDVERHSFSEQQPQRSQREDRSERRLDSTPPVREQPRAIEQPRAREDSRPERSIPERSFRQEPRPERSLQRSEPPPRVEQRSSEPRPAPPPQRGERSSERAEPRQSPSEGRSNSHQSSRGERSGPSFNSR